MTVPYALVLDGSTTIGRTARASNAVAVANTVAGTSSGGTIRCVNLVGTVANAFSGYLAFAQSDGTAKLAIADFEIRTQINTPNGANVGPALVARFSPSGDYQGYLLRESTPGNPTSWALGWYADNSPEKLYRVSADLIPHGGVTDYTDLWIRWAGIGEDHYIKIWKGSGGANEPDYWWHLRDVGGKTAAGDIGVGVWGADANSEYAAFSNIKVAVWNDVLISVGSTTNNAASTAAASSYDCTFDAPKDTPLIVVVESSTGAVPTVSGSNLQVDLTLAAETTGGTATRTSLVRCRATADIIGGTLTASFGANQTGCNIIVNPCGGVVGTVPVGTEPDSGSGRTSLTVNGVFVYPTSGTYAVLTKINQNAATLDTGFVSCGDTTHSSPNVGTHACWRSGNDSSVAFSWTGSVRSCALACELQLANPATHGDYAQVVSGLWLPARKRQPMRTMMLR